MLTQRELMALSAKEAGEGAVRYARDTSTLFISADGEWLPFTFPEPEPAVLASFMVNKNNVDQTGVPQGTETLVTWSNEVYDNDNYFDTTTSLWSPPAGLVILSGKVQIESGLNIGDIIRVRIFKNAAVLMSMNNVYSSSTVNIDANFIGQDFCDGDDTYGISVNVGSGAGSDKVIQGATGATFLQGILLSA